jgi:hypothetical protein
MTLDFQDDSFAFSFFDRKSLFSNGKLPIFPIASKPVDLAFDARSNRTRLQTQQRPSVVPKNASTYILAVARLVKVERILR